MANITLKDLVEYSIGVNLDKAPKSFIQDLAENELDLKGSGNLGCDVVIRLGGKFYPVPCYPKSKPFLF
jgi:hypothetical protein